MAAVTYDQPEVLRRFAQAHRIGYPILSDRGSRVIESFGILNTNFPPDHPFYGIPFPGDFLIAPDGKVAAKFFLSDYQTRPASSRILLARFGDLADGDSVRVEADELAAVVRLSTGAAAPGQEIGVAADFSLKPGWHVYAEPIPSSYTALAIAFEADLVQEQSFVFPAPAMVRFEALGETLAVLSESFRVTGRLTVRLRTNPGKYGLRGTLRFQMCDDTTCKVPQSLGFELPLRVEGYAPPAPK